MFSTYFDNPNFSNHIDFGAVSLNGQSFLISMPTVELWNSFQHFLNSNIAYKNHWDSFFQPFSGERNLVTGVRPGDSIVTMRNARVLPILLPIHNGKLDREYLQDIPNGNVLVMGELFVDGNAVEPKDMFDHYWAISIKETDHDVLPWMKFGNVLFGPFILKSEYSVEILVNRFRNKRWFPF